MIPFLRPSTVMVAASLRRLPSLRLASTVYRHVTPTAGELVAPARSMHVSSVRASVRSAGTTRAAKYVSKRVLDQQKEEEAAANRVKVFDTTEEFFAQIDKTYSDLHAGLRDMLLENACMSFDVSAADHRLEISLGESSGSFIFTPDETTQRFTLFSPISANAYIYHFDTQNARWIADSDAHIFEELFVREILQSQHLKGFPQL